MLEKASTRSVAGAAKARRGAQTPRRVHPALARSSRRRVRKLDVLELREGVRDTGGAPREIVTMPSDPSPGIAVPPAGRWPAWPQARPSPMESELS